MEITNDIRYAGVNDHQVDLFEGQYKVPNGMAYNSYVILDDKIAVMDTVDVHFSSTWLSNIKNILGDKKPDYLIIQHMEPDHSASIEAFVRAYPDATVVTNAQADGMIHQFFENIPDYKVKLVGNGESLSLGKHTLTFVFAPMVHWPEVMVTYDSCDKVLFSADGFGKFGANDVDEPWDDESRRYFIGIVGKYGKQVQDLLKAAATLDIQKICPLHGPVLTKNLGHYINLYDKWSSYTPEEEGIVICYTSVYGHTKEAALKLAEMLKKDAPKVEVYDLARDDMAAAVAAAFRYSKIVLATTTYNAGIYPFMHTFLFNLTERNFRNRTLGFIENGTWAPAAAKLMRAKLKECPGLHILENNVTIHSALNKDSRDQLDKMAAELTREYVAASDHADKQDKTALFRIGYGLYVITAKDGDKDNGLIGNSVMQIADNPTRIAVNINKNNYTHDMVKKTGKLNVNCLDVTAPFELFTRFGFQSGRNVDKFDGFDFARTDNGIAMLTKHVNAVISLTVRDYMDMGSHGMFICTIDESRTVNNNDTMTYTYYQKNVKPKPEKKVTGWVCTVCGFIYEGEELPEDYICPICKHGAEVFEKL